MGRMPAEKAEVGQRCCGTSQDPEASVQWPVVPYDCWTLEDGAVIIGVLDHVLIPEAYLLLKYLEDRSCGIFRLVIYE